MRRQAKSSARRHIRCRALGSLLRTATHGNEGSVAVIMGLTSLALIGAAGLGVEVSSWYMVKRDLQNAADSAALAAASNAGPTAQQEGKAAANQYVFRSASGITVNTPTVSPVLCPKLDPSSTVFCSYKAQISGSVPLLPFAHLAGLSGNITISSTAVALRGAKYCVVGLNKTPDKTPDFLIDGTPNLSLGCDIISNDNAQCNGSQGSLGNAILFAVGDTRKCQPAISGVPPFTDPYQNRVSNNINPSKTCSAAESDAGATWSIDPQKGLISSTGQTVTWTPDKNGVPSYTVCGGLSLEKNSPPITITGPDSGGAVLYIYNGDLSIGTNQTLNANNVTIVFAGDPNYVPPLGKGHAPKTISDFPEIASNGVLRVTAPTSGIWQDFALVQDPSLTPSSTTTLDMTISGNAELDITGLWYFPHSNITKGAVNKSAAACYAIVSQSLEVDGTGYSLTQPNNCSLDWLSFMPHSRARLVE